MSEEEMPCWYLPDLCCLEWQFYDNNSESTDSTEKL